MKNVALLFVFLLLGFSYILAYLGKKIKIPPVVSFIIAGLIIGTNFFKDNLIGGNLHYIIVLGNFSLFILMFLAGMEEKVGKVIVCKMLTFGKDCGSVFAISRICDSP